MGFQKALLEAQAVSRDQHRRKLASCLDEQDEPLTITVRLPRAAGEGADAADARSRVEVPIYSLLPHRSLELKEAELELEVDVHGLSPDGEPTAEAAKLDLSRLDVRLVTPAGRPAPKARLRVRFEAARLSEVELPRVDLELLEEVTGE